MSEVLKKITELGLWGLLVWLFRMLPIALTENAVFGWIDDQIGHAFGLTAPSVATVASWVIPFLLAGIVVWIYHQIVKRISTQSRERTAVLEPWHVIVLGLLVAFGGVAWQQWPKLRNSPSDDVRKNIASGSSNRDANISEVAVSARKLSPYEIERKLKAIDEILGILSKDIDPILILGPRLESRGWIALKETDSNANYIHELVSYRDAIKKNAAKLNAFRDANPEYPDIANNLKIAHFEAFVPAVDNFISAWQRIAYLNVEDRVDQVSWQLLMRPHVDAFERNAQSLRNWTEAAKSYVIALRKSI